MAEYHILGIVRLDGVGLRVTANNENELTEKLRNGDFVMSEWAKATVIDCPYFQISPQPPAQKLAQGTRTESDYDS